MFQMLRIWQSSCARFAGEVMREWYEGEVIRALA
jgi:hypothetical protein